MSTEGGNIGEIPENHMEDTLKPAEQNLSELHHGTNGNLPLEDGLCGGSPYSSEDRDQLEQMAMELTFQNEFLKSQFQGVKNFQLMSNVATEHRGSEQERAQKLQERIESLNKQLLEEKQTRSAAEEALKHLQTLYSEADAKAQELSEKLVEGQIYMQLYTFFGEENVFYDILLKISCYESYGAQVQLKSCFSF